MAVSKKLYYIIRKLRKISFKALLLYFLLPFSIGVYSQGSTIDSLQKLLQTQKDDTNKVNILYQLSEECEEGEILKYAFPALELAEKLHYKKGIADASNNISYVYFNQSDYSRALEYSHKSLKMYEEIGDKKGISASLNSLGTSYFQQGDLMQALEYLYKAFKIKREIGDKKGMANSLINIGEIYDSQGDIPHAIEYWQESLKLSEEIGFKYGIACSLFSIGYCYNIQGDVHKSMEYLQKGLKIQQDIGDKQGIANSFNSIGKSYYDQGVFSMALVYYKKSLKIAEDIKDTHGTAAYLNNIGSIYLKQKKFKQAEIYFSRSLQIAKDIGHPKRISDASKNLSKVYSQEGKYKEAYQMHVLFKQMADSVNNIETRKSALKKQMQYEFDKKETFAKAEQDKKAALAIAEINNQKIIRNFSWVSTIAVLLFATYSFYRFRRRKKMETEQEMLKERLRISRELHDDIGSTLSGIAMYSHLTKEQIKHSNTKEVEKSLNIMQQSADEMVNKLNDIVWLINRNQDSLEKLIQRLEEYATDMAMIKNIQIKVNVPANLAEHILPVENRRNIYLFCKEAINNAVKYSNASSVELTVKEVDKKLEFSVRDNGEGFDAVMVRRGNGLENMQKRADEIGAKLLLQSKTNEGCLVSLQCSKGMS